MMKEPVSIIDISQPISRSYACYPGDTPFDYTLTASFAQNKCYNLTAFTMSPHIGSHADAPAHVLNLETAVRDAKLAQDLELESLCSGAGHSQRVLDRSTANDSGSRDCVKLASRAAVFRLDTMEPKNLAGHLPLAPFIGPCLVIDVSPCKGEITLKSVENKLKGDIPLRILFKTRLQLRFDQFDEEYAYFSLDLIDFLHAKGVKLIGIDTPSVDHIHSKTLDAHHALIAHGMVWIENLDLSQAQENTYFLSALPLKLMELEAAPLRAVLISL